MFFDRQSTEKNECSLDISLDSLVPRNSSSDAISSPLLLFVPSTIIFAKNFVRPGEVEGSEVAPLFVNNPIWAMGRSFFSMIMSSEPFFKAVLDGIGGAKMISLPGSGSIFLSIGEPEGIYSDFGITLRFTLLPPSSFAASLTSWGVISVTYTHLTLQTSDLV